MARVKLTEVAKKIVQSAQSRGIIVRVSRVEEVYCAYAFYETDFADCMHAFSKKLPSSSLTRDAYAAFCFNKLLVWMMGKTQESACRSVVNRLKNRKKKVVHGVLEPFFEQGTEGIYWSVHEDGKKGYDGLHIIDPGDYLTIYDKRGAVIFEGRIFPDHKAGWKEYSRMPGSGLGQPYALGCGIHWTQIGWEPDAWARFFLRGKEPPLRAKLVTYR